MDWDPRYLYRQLIPDPEEMERFLVEVGFFEWNLHQDLGRPFSEAVAELCQRFPHYQELIQAYDERYEESLAGAIEPTVDILRILKQVGYPLYGLSNWSAEKYALVKDKYPFFSWFDGVVISGEVRLIKPDPRIFQLLLERIGRPAGECLFIDDSAKNISIAGELGFETIHFRSADQLNEDFKKRKLIP